VSDLASAAGDWQSLSSRGHPYKSSHLRMERERWAEARVLRSARGRVCGIKHVFEQNLLLSGGSLVLVGETHGWWPQACYKRKVVFCSSRQPNLQSRGREPMALPVTAYGSQTILSWKNIYIRPPPCNFLYRARSNLRSLFLKSTSLFFY